MSYSLQVIESPIGMLYLVGKGDRLAGLIYPALWPRFAARFSGLVDQETPLLAETKRQLLAYFAGRRTCFELPLALDGTPFQKRVWAALADIPYGATASYKDQAVAIHAPQAVRAVGRANGLNPVSIVVPCHRVVGSSGALIGYGGGLAAKRALLNLESGQAAHRDACGRSGTVGG